MEKNSYSVAIEQALESKLTLRGEKPNGFCGGYNVEEAHSEVNLLADVEDIPIATMTKVVEEEHSKADLLVDEEVIEMSNVSIATNLDIMHQIVGTINMRSTMNNLILLRHQMLKKKNVQFFLHKRR